MTLNSIMRLGRVALVAAGLISLTGAAPQELDKSTKDDVLLGITQLLEAHAFVPGADFTKVDGYFAAEKDKIDKADTDEEFRGAISDALDKFGFSHIVLFTPQMVEQRRKNAATGIGIMAQYKDHTLIIHQIFPNAPAEEAGLESGDVILEVDGKQPEHAGSLAGEEGTKVKLKIKKFDGTEKVITLTRRRFSTVIPPSVKWPDKDTAVIKIPTFDLSYDASLVDALVDEAMPAKNVVLDLRSNGGGTVLNMCHLLGHFMPADKPIGIFVTKKLVTDFVSETSGSPSDFAKMASWSPRKVYAKAPKTGMYTGNLAVLVNIGSGSASEIAAEALRETLSVPIVGEKSAGKVLVSVLAPLPHGYQLQYPITDYISAKGIRLEGAGVTPDLEAKDPRVSRPGVDDEPIDKAVAILHRAQLRNERYGTGPGAR